MMPANTVADLDLDQVLLDVEEHCRLIKMKIVVRVPRLACQIASLFGRKPCQERVPVPVQGACTVPRSHT